MLRNPIVYAHTKFGEDILIGGGDTSGSKIDARCRLGPSYVSPCKILGKSDNRRPSNLTFSPFKAHFGAPFAPTDFRVEMTHPHPVGTMWSLTSFFRLPQKSSSSKWRHSEQEWYRSLGRNLGLLPPVKMGRGGANFCGFFWSSARAPTDRTKTTGVHPADLDPQVPVSKKTKK